MKKCSTCKEEKLPSEFRRSGRRADGLQDSCRVCAKARDRRHYVSDPGRTKRIQAGKLRSVARSHAVILAHLQDNPCVDCGEADPIVLELDHVRGAKVAAVTELARRGVSVEKVVAEIGKCDVRCANCHRRRTYFAGGHKSRGDVVTVSLDERRDSSAR